MPEIIINEKDNTSGTDITATNYKLVILGDLPLKAGYRRTENSGDGEFEFDYVNEGTEFNTVVDIPTTGNTSLTPIIVPALCKLGMKVLYVRESGLDASDITVDKIAGKEDGTEEGILSRFKDKSKYEYRFISIGDYANKADGIVETFNKAIIRIANSRQEIVALNDLPVSKKAVTAETVENYFNTLGFDTYHTNFAPWWNLTSMDENGNVKDNHLPGSVAYLGAFINHIKTYKEWYAMSGVIRGVLPWDNFKPLINYGDAEINNILQKRRDNANPRTSVNVLCNINPYGNVIWGNRTAFKIDNNDLKASHFLNIRHLCITLKQLLYRVCRQLTFEPNSDLLWTEFCDLIRPTLEEMKTNQGIAGYKIIRLNNVKKAQLRAIIKIVPIEAVEDFELTVSLEDSIEVNE